MTGVAPIALGAILLLAGAQKLLNPAAFRAALVRYDRFPVPVRRTTLRLLPPAEGVLGVALVVGVVPLVAAGLALALLMALTGAFAFQRPGSSCGCLASPALGVRAHLAQNGALAGLAVVALWDAKFGAGGAGAWIRVAALGVSISAAVWQASRAARSNWLVSAKIRLMHRYHLRRRQWTPEEVVQIKPP